MIRANKTTSGGVGTPTVLDSNVLSYTFTEDYDYVIASIAVLDGSGTASTIDININGVDVGTYHYQLGPAGAIWRASSSATISGVHAGDVLTFTTTVPTASMGTTMGSVIIGIQ